MFDPWDLQLGITPAAIREAIKEEDFANGKFLLQKRLVLVFNWFQFSALTMSIKLNEIGLIHEVIECIPIKDGK